MSRGRKGPLGLLLVVASRTSDRWGLYEGEVCDVGTCTRPPFHGGAHSQFDGPPPPDEVPFHPIDAEHEQRVIERTKAHPTFKCGCSVLVYPDGICPCVRRELPERILCAAIWVDTGEAHPPRRSYAYPKTGILFCGWRHPDCFVPLQAWADRLTPEERVRIGEEQLAGRHQGFLTSRGRFVDREEGMVLARAAGQTASEKRDLFSEDVY